MVILNVLLIYNTFWKADALLATITLYTHSSSKNIETPESLENIKAKSQCTMDPEIIKISHTVFLISILMAYI